MAAALRLLAVALLAGGCAFDPSGTLGASADAGAAMAIDAPSVLAEGDGGAPREDAGVDPDAGEPISADAGAPIDAAPAPECGGFGEACCDEGDACGTLLFCVGGTCI